MKPKVRDEPDAKPLDLKGGEIKFDNVHFRFLFVSLVLTFHVEGQIIWFQVESV